MDNALTQVGNYLLGAVLATGGQIFALLAPALILALVMQVVTNFVNDNGYRALGPRLFHSLFKFVGTAVHETGHALFCVIFGHRILHFAPWDPDPDTGVLGSVTHGYNRHNLYQRVGNFFISIGPLILGPLVLYLAASFLVGGEIFQPLRTIQLNSDQLTSLNSLWATLKSVYTASLALLQAMFTPTNLGNWKFYLFIYLAFSVGSSIRLSGLDLRNAVDGFLVLIGLIFLFNLATQWAGNFAGQAVGALSQSYGFFYSILIFAILLNCLVGLVFLPLAVLRNARSG